MQSRVGEPLVADRNRVALLAFIAALGEESLRRVADLGDERFRTARGAKALVAEVSDTAERFFAKRGYEGQQRNTISVGDEWLANTTMKKKLAANEGTP